MSHLHTHPSRIFKFQTGFDTEHHHQVLVCCLFVLNRTSDLNPIYKTLASLVRQISSTCCEKTVSNSHEGGKCQEEESHCTLPRSKTASEDLQFFQ